ncbi:MAG TPA: penicillin-binding protein 2 [Desulfotomaculum sp.]|nr:penicillin-binding protein 2 [Desulfotomaculum sp.]
MEKKVIEKRMKIYTGILAVFFVALILRMGYMQIAQANKYRTLATQNHQRLITVEAPRGEIIDRNGVRIVSNKPVYTVSLVYLGLKDSTVVIKQLAALLEGEATFQGMTAQQIESHIQEKINDHKRLYEPVRVAADVSQETINRIDEHRLELPGVNIDIEPVRSYPFGDLMGEVLGYVREITGEQLEARRDEGYNMGDSFGQVGLENIYESYLRGVNGARQVEVDAQGHPVRDLGLKQPVPGNNLILTIDQRLQRVAQDAIMGQIEEARRLGYAKLPPGKAAAGAAVVTDVKTGEVLAMATVPSYDLNVFSGPLPASKYGELLNNRSLRNHAIQTTFTPGSTFKMVTASALLEEKILNIHDSISDPGYYKYKKDWKPGGHGVVNIVKALRDSCDTFFYQFGIQAGPDLMNNYAARYGLGQPTGIDLPGEEVGRVASKELKKKVWAGNEWESQWREYDSMDMAIGQQETKVTALQLANYVEAIANGGTIYRPHLAKRVISNDGNELFSFQPEVLKKVDVSVETLDIVRQGMHEVTIGGGTASGVFWGAPYTAAAKTGTAEVGDAAQNNHALFVAYAPYENPEIAVSVIIEYGGKGSGIAGPAARKILDAYFQFKKEDAQGKSPAQAAQQSEQPQTGQTTLPGSTTPPAAQEVQPGSQGQGAPSTPGTTPQDGGATSGAPSQDEGIPDTPATGTESGAGSGSSPPPGGVLPPQSGGETGGTADNTGRQQGGGQGEPPAPGANGNQVGLPDPGTNGGQVNTTGQTGTQ